MKKRQLFILLFSIFLVISSLSETVISNTDESEITNVLSLTPSSLSWHLWGQSEDSVNFKFSIDLTITNIHLTDIIIGFGDGCLWDSSVKCNLQNKSLETKNGGKICTFACVFLTFPPGQTNSWASAQVFIYDPTITELPKGLYEITIGEWKASIYEEIIAPARISLEISDNGSEISFNENPFKLKAIPLFSVLFPILFVISYFYNKKRNNILRMKK